MKILLFLLAGIGAAVCQTYGDVRLVGSQNSSGVGIVEVYILGRWGSVQPLDYMGVGRAVCRQLGYNDVDNSESYSVMRDSCDCEKLDSSIPSLLSNGDCYSQSSYTPDAPTHILQCNHLYTTNTSPDHGDDLVVKCSSISITFLPYDSQVRLVQGGTGYMSSGYVEVYLNNRWGPVCGMSKAAADTTCRQLGYSYSSNHRDTEGYGSSYTPQVSTFTCASSRNCLRSCIHYPSLTDSTTCAQKSVVDCTFTNAFSTTYGSQSACSVDFPTVAVAVGIVIAFFFVLIVIAVIVCSLCCCIPSCLLYSATRGPRRVVYETI